MENRGYSVPCPLCGEPMNYQENGIWSCLTCPGILFEFTDKESLDKLTTYLTKDNVSDVEPSVKIETPAGNLVAKRSPWTGDGYPGIYVGLEGQDEVVLVEYQDKEVKGDDSESEGLVVHIWNANCDCEPVIRHVVTPCSQCKTIKGE